MKKALIITWEKYQDHELIYPYYSLKEHGYEVDIMANKIGKIWGSLGTHMLCTLQTSNFENQDKIQEALKEYEILLIV
jgi:putative intracellular protease/amidase